MQNYSVIRKCEFIRNFSVESWEPSCSIHFAQYSVVIIHIACYNC